MKMAKYEQVGLITQSVFLKHIFFLGAVAEFVSVGRALNALA